MQLFYKVNILIFYIIIYKYVYTWLKREYLKVWIYIYIKFNHCTRGIHNIDAYICIYKNKHKTTETGADTGFK